VVISDGLILKLKYRKLNDSVNDAVAHTYSNTNQYILNTKLNSSNALLKWAKV